MDQLSINRSVLQFLKSGAHLVTKKIPFTILATESETEKKTGFVLPANAMVVDAWPKINTAGASTSTLAAGTDSEDSGDADGFFAGVDVTSTGITLPGPTVADGVIGANTRGALLCEYAQGNAADDRGLYLEKACTSMGGKEVTITGTLPSGSIAGHLYICYYEM